MVSVKLGMLLGVTKSRSFLLLTWFSISLLFGTLVMSSFAVCDHSDGASLTSAYQYKQSSHEKSIPESNIPVEDCSQSVCHFGHCSSLVIPAVSGISFAHSMKVDYFLKFKTPHDRFLDVPYQPPKNA